MAREILRDQQPNMAGGLNTVSTASALAKNQLRRTENARLTEFGAIRKRGGTQRIHPTALGSGSSIQGGFMWRKDNGDKVVLAVSNGTLYTHSVGPIPVVPGAQIGSLSSTERPTFAKFRDTSGNDVVYIADGGQLNSWDGTTLSTDISSIATKSIVVHNERLWSCGCNSNPQSVFYSSLNNGDTLGDSANDGGEIVVRTFGDQVTQGLLSLGSSLLIFHRRGISRLTGYGEDDIVADPAALTGDIGVVAPLSLVEHNNRGYFLSERGLYVCNESQIQRVGSPESPDPLQPLLRKMSEEDFDSIVAEMNEATQELMVFIPEEGVYLYNTILNAWSGPFTGSYTTSRTTCLFVALDHNDVPQMYKGSEDGWIALCDPNEVYLDDVGHDGTGGTVVDMAVQFHRMYFGTRSQAKTFRWGYLTADFDGGDESSFRWSSQLGSGVYSLPASTSSRWGSGIWGTGSWGGGELSFRIPMSGKGYYIDATFSDSSEAGLPGISSVEFEAYLLGRR